MGFFTILGPVLLVIVSGVFIAVIVSVIGRLSGLGLGIAAAADFTCVIVVFEKALVGKVCTPPILGCKAFDVLPCWLAPTNTGF